MANYGNIQRSKISKYDLSNTWRGNRGNIQDVIICLNMIINRVVYVNALNINGFF